MHNESIFWPSCNMQLPRALTSVRMRHNIFSRRLALSTSNFDKNFEESSSDSYENMKKIWVVCKHTCVWCLLIAINLNCVNIIKFIIYLSRRCFFFGKNTQKYRQKNIISYYGAHAISFLDYKIIIRQVDFQISRLFTCNLIAY